MIKSTPDGRMGQLEAMLHRERELRSAQQNQIASLRQKVAWPRPGATRRGVRHWQFLGLLLLACAVSGCFPFSSASHPKPVLKDMGGIAVDQQGSIYIVSANHLLKLAPDGSQVASFSGLPAGTQGTEVSLQKLAVDRQGDIFLTVGGLSSVEKLSSQGKVLASWPVDTATGVTVARTGSVFVTGYAGSDGALYKLSSQGRTLATYHHNLDTPTNVGLDSRGNVYVNSFNTPVIYKFSGSAQKIAQFGPLSSTPEGATQILAMTVGPHDVIYAVVGDSIGSQIDKVSPDGKPLGHFGSIQPGPSDWGTSGITTDASGNIYVADIGHREILKYSPGGKLIATFKSAK